MPPECQTQRVQTNSAPSTGVLRAAAPVPLSSHNDELYTISPWHVLLVGAGVLASGALVTASLSYKKAEKQLAAEGIDPHVRRIILPHALRALAASLFMTGCVAGAGFYALRSCGLVASDTVAVPPLREAWRVALMRDFVVKQGGGSNGRGQQQEQKER